MNRSLRPKRNVSSKSSVANEWKSGEEVFSMTPSPMKRKTSSRRDTKMGLKKVSGKASPKFDRRKSLILKRLETDLANNADSEIISRKRTRRQSMASIPKAESKMVKKQIPRAKSEKIIANNKTSTSNLPTVKIEKLRASNVETKLRHSETSKKPLSKTEESTSISKVSFYSKSPVRTRQTRNQSMIKMGDSKASLSILKSPRPFRTDVKLKIKSESKMETSPSNEKSLPHKSKVPVIVKCEAPQKISPEKKLPQRNTKTEKKEEKAKTPLRKPVKRLSNMTPSPVPLHTKRLTRSCAKKKVKIFADSPMVNVDYRKTPKSGNKMLYRETPISSEKISVGILKPYTPKPEEPLKILKQTLKRNIASEMRNSLQTDVSDFVRPSIVSVRNLQKSTTSSPAPAAAAYLEESSRSPKKFLTNESPIKNGIHHHHQEESYSRSFQTPSTPVSSRKSVSFRRFRGSVRLIDDEPLRKNDDVSECNILKNPLNSTPVRFGKNNENYHISDDHETSMDLSDVSPTHEESKCSVSSSYTTHDRSYSSHHIEESSSEVSTEESQQLENKQQQQTTKRRYCVLM